MKKIILIAGLGLLTTAGVTAAVLSSNNKKKAAKDTEKKECVYKSKSTKTAKRSCSF